MKVTEYTLEKFRIAIVKSKIKKKDIAKGMGISQGYFSNMLRGHEVLLDAHRESLNILLKTKY